MSCWGGLSPDFFKNDDTLETGLVVVAKLVGGEWFALYFALSMFAILVGACIAGYVGTSGLLSSSSQEGCLPLFLTHRNTRGSYPWIVAAFAAMCVSVLVVARGNIVVLGALYAVSFLSVMTLFAVAFILLKLNRPKLKRVFTAPAWVGVVVGVGMFAGALGNIVFKPENGVYFLYYFVPIMAGILAFARRDLVVKAIAYCTRSVDHYLQTHLQAVIDGKYVLFLRDRKRLGQYVRYVLDNEPGRKICVVVCGATQEALEEWKGDIEAARRVGTFDVKLELIAWPEQTFGSEAIARAARELEVPRNYIFTGSLHEHHAFTYADLAPVRIIGA